MKGEASSVNSSPSSATREREGPNRYRAYDDSILLRGGSLTGAASSSSSSSSTSSTRGAAGSYIASNGAVYEIAPYCLPPPADIAEAINEMRGRRERGDSNLGLASESKGPSAGTQIDNNASASETSPSGRPNRKLATLTPFSPATLNSKELEWMQQGRPSGTPVKGGDGGDGGVGGGVVKRLVSLALSIPDNTAANNAKYFPLALSDDIDGEAVGNGSVGANNNSNSNSTGGIGGVSLKKGGQLLSRSLSHRSRTTSAPEFTNMNEGDSPLSPQTALSPENHAAFASSTNNNEAGTDNPHQSTRDPRDQPLSAGVLPSLPHSNSNLHLSDLRERLIDDYASKQVPPSQGEYFHMRKFSLYKYLKVEMFGSSVGETGNGERRGSDNITNFLTVPFKIERMVVFGFFVCLDAFAYTLTYLPVRFLYSFYVLCKEVLVFLLTSLLPGRNAKLVSLGTRYFHRTHAYDIMVGSLMVIGVSALQMLNMGRVYHYIRGQNMIKLYVLTGMLEIFDKLLASFGQDAFDSLYWQTRRYDGQETGKIAFSFIIVAFYVILHSGSYFIHIATLTVAINSAEQALITVLILNNFAEIKSFVFKKFDKQNLFQLACSDITERFQLTLFLTVITGVALAQSGSLDPAGWNDVVRSHCYIILAMMTGESVADWIKHAFISKFNFIDASVYDDFMRVLRKDILNSHKDKVILNHTYAITRRVGLSQIPLGCVAVRYFNLAFSSMSIRMAYLALPLTRRVLLCVGGFSAMLLFKICIGIALVFISGKEHNKELDAKAAKLQERTEGGKAPFVKRESLAQLSNIERYTVYKGRVVG